MVSVKIEAVAGTDTESELMLSVDGVLIDHSLITGARLALFDSDLELNSVSNPQAWDFSDAAKIVVKFGCGDLTPGRYRGRLVTVDMEHPKGMAWDDDLEIYII